MGLRQNDQMTKSRSSPGPGFDRTSSPDESFFSRASDPEVAQANSSAIQQISAIGGPSRKKSGVLATDEKSLPGPLPSISVMQNFTGCSISRARTAESEEFRPEAVID